MRVSRLIPSSVIASILVAGAAQAAPYPFADNFESGVGNWVTNGLWGLTSSDAHSASQSATDSPGRFYTNHTDAALELGSSINLSAATAPVLTFYHRHSLETGYDEATVEVSTNGGGSWVAPALATYTGNLEPWTREQLDLGAYGGQSDVRVRFRLQTDSSIVKDGWYIDDVAAGEAPAAPGALVASSSSPTRVDLSWAASAGPNLDAYRIYRSLAPGTAWRTGQVIAELGNSVTSYTDVAVSPKTTYYYQVMALDTSERHALSDEQSVTTATGMDYPFLDNGEGGGATWNAEAPWALSDEDALSPTRAWTESPGTNYEDSVNASLTLAAPMDLSAAIAPALCFAHKHDFASGDSGNAEVSVNGSDWTSLEQFTGSSGGAWLRARYDLSAYVGEATVYVRLRFTSDHANVADGWHVDDISVAESPATINAPVITEVASHSMRLTWTASANDHFSHYAVYQSTATDVGFNDTLVTTITERATATCVAGGLALDTEYYFRVYEVSGYQTYSANGTENHDRTLNHPIPFADGFEGSLLGWNLTGTWGADGTTTHGGNFSLGDSPGTTYTSSVDSYAVTAVDLTGTAWPVLRFWDRYQFNSGDWGAVEVSPNGTSWTRVYSGKYTSRMEWREQQISLTPWRGQANLRIRFHMWTDSPVTTLGDGWNIDDLSVADHTPVTIPYPFSEGFESAPTNWLFSSWDRTTNDVRTGTYALLDKPTAHMGWETHLSATLAGELDLTGATNPQLTYYLRGQLSGRTSFGWYISTDGGVNWATVAGTSVGNVTLDWTRYQASLASYAGQVVHLRGYTSADRYGYDIQVALDDVVIEESPTNAVLAAPVPHLKSVDLSWTKSTLGADFKRYELRRDTNPNVDINDVLIGEYTDVNTTNVTDSGLSIGAIYYYRLFVVNQRDVYSTGSERSATTVPLAIGFTDDMDDLDLWDATGTWGPDTLIKRSGAASLGDSPGDDYLQSTDSYILTAVDLSSATWPLLTFWDRYQFNSGDWGFLEISPDGSTWTRVYSGKITSRTEWSEQQIDLRLWKGHANVRIRFHIQTDSGAGTRAYGWNIDDLSIAEHTPVTIPYPFFEGFESDPTNWLFSSWDRTTNDVHTGTYALLDKPTADMGWSTYLPATLAGALDLTGATNPQLKYYLRGQLSGRTSFGWYVSTDGGVNWATLPGTTIGSVTLDWTRYQASLASYAGQVVHLRGYTSADRYGYAIQVALDDIVVEESPTNVVLAAPVPHLKTIDLSWTPSALGANFKRYEIYRDTNPNVTLDDTLIASITDVNTTEFTDSGLEIGTTYYYRLYVVNQNDAYSTGSERSATTVPLALGLTDPMENLDNWNATGTWGVDTQYKHGGAASVSDSPGDDYPVSTDTHLLTAVDLSAATWPVLRFWDRYELNGGDSFVVEVSPNGTTWTRLYGQEFGTRTNWQEHAISLTQWRGEPNLRIRFHMWTDSGAGTRAYGWNVDDVSVTEHVPQGVSYPFYEDFESTSTLWLASSWHRTMDDPAGGSYCFIDKTTSDMTPSTFLPSEVAVELNLSNAVSPQLTYELRGQLSGRTSFGWYVSTDGGVNWATVSGTSIGGVTLDWTRYEIPLAAYVGQTIHLRYGTYADNYGNAIQVAVDNIGIGEPTPGAPRLHSPVQLESVPVLRPTLRVYNATDYQGDALDYEFRIYSDALLSNLVASVPAVAQGVSITAWEVDTDLPDGAQYWWRCRAADTGGPGPWMDTAIFYVSHVNNPPYPVELVGPPPASILHDLDHVLSWKSTSDPDTGGIIKSYHMQISTGINFAVLGVDDPTIEITGTPPGPEFVIAKPLATFSNSAALIPETYYYWRMRACDQWDLWSDWSTNVMWFIYGTPPPTIGEMAPQSDGSFEMNWERSGKAVYIEHSPTLIPADWQPVAGPIHGTNAVAAPPPGSKRGYFRTRTE